MKTQFQVYLFLSILLLSLSRCTTRYAQTGDSVSNPSYSSLEQTESDKNQNIPTNRKIIFSAYLKLVVTNIDSTNHQMEKIAQQYQGYVNELGTDRTIIRVKSDQLEAALFAINTLGKVQQKNTKGQDVTEAYLDYQIRLDNAEKARIRYLELLDLAENVEDALKIEKELERLNETIDLLKGKMNRINHLADFSTITVDLKEQKKPGILGYIGLGLYHSVKWLFVRN